MLEELDNARNEKKKKFSITHLILSFEFGRKKKSNLELLLKIKISYAQYSKPCPRRKVLIQVFELRSYHITLHTRDGTHCLPDGLAKLKYSQQFRRETIQRRLM